MIITHRNTLWKLLPPWARGFYLFSVLYVFGLIFDALGDALVAAVKIRFPGLYSYEGLDRHATERGLFQGPNETDEAFSTRLKGWWEVAKRSGSFYTIAQQVQAHALPATFRVDLVTNSGYVYRLDTDGTWSEFQTAWDWDGDTTQCSRFWLVVEGNAANVTGFDRIIDRPGETIDWPGTLIDCYEPYLNRARLDVTDALRLREIVEYHRPPNTYLDSILYLLNPTAFWADPPHGDYGDWEVRSPHALFWRGTT